LAAPLGLADGNSHENMIIYINGSINAGKSTVASLLARTLPNTIHIEVDSLRNFARCLTLEEAIPFCLEDTAFLTRNWAERKFNVVIDWLISEEDYCRFIHLLGDCPAPVFAFTLAPRLEIALTNRGERELTDREYNRIQFHYSRGIASPAFGTVIDNSDQTPEQTVQEIMNVINQI
jgi:hypothetical protein